MTASWAWDVARGLRWGEVTALRRCHIDIQAGTVTIARQHVQLDTGGVVVTAPK
jgi:integrase